MSRTGLSPSMADLSRSVLLSDCFVTPMWKTLQPRRGRPPRFGLFRVRSPLLTESIFLSIPPVTEMFHFAGLAARRLCIQRRLIRAPRDQCSFVNSPEFFADFHALHRLLMPRHPPCALSSLATRIQYSPRTSPETSSRKTQFERLFWHACYLSKPTYYSSPPTTNGRQRQSEVSTTGLPEQRSII